MKSPRTPAVPIIAALALVTSAEAATFTVTTAADEFNTPSGVTLSLREALRDAAAASGADTIVFAPGLDGQSIVLGSEIVANDTGGVTVDASALAGGLTITGNHGGRIFSAGTGTILTLRSLTLTGGTGAGAAAGGNGGAIYNLGALALAQCTLAGNSAGTNGGAIYNAGMLTLTQCTLTGNSAGSNGGAILNGGTMTLTHDTVSGNSAGFGGAIANGGPLTLINSIVGRNTASAGQGADVYNIFGTMTCVGANIVPVIYNGAGTVTGPAPITADPLLAPPGNYGGPTPTMALMPGSPAIDAVPAGSTVTGLDTDQRGFARLRDGNSNGAALPDIGAFESGMTRVTTTADESDTPGGATVSLREAVRDASAGDIIVFDPAVFTASAHTISLDATKGEILLAKSFFIDASNLPAGVGVDGGSGTNRLFFISYGQSVFLSGLSLTGGKGAGAISSGTGGAVYNTGTLILTRCTLRGNSALGNAGAIFSQGMVTATDCALSENTAANGGAILNGGTFTLTRCTLSANSAPGGTGGAVNNAGDMTVTHSTFSGNSASSGGALFNNGTTTLKHATVSANSAANSGGGVYTTITSLLTLAHSIVAGNIAPAGQGADIQNVGTVTRGGVNIVQSLSGRAALGNDTIIAADPKLAPLGSYGGLTQTMALGSLSPARNAAVGSTATADQRGFPIVGIPDMGAYEAGTTTYYDAWIWEALPVTATAAEHAQSFDFDGDGATNAQEWALLSDPAIPAGTLRIVSSIRSGGNLTLTFPTITGRNYTLSRLDSPAGGTWTDSGQTVIPGDGTLKSFTVATPVAGVPNRFYRVQAAP